MLGKSADFRSQAGNIKAKKHQKTNRVMSKGPRARFQGPPLAIEATVSIEKNNDYNGHEALNNQTFMKP